MKIETYPLVTINRDGDVCLLSVFEEDTKENKKLPNFKYMVIKEEKEFGKMVYSFFQTFAGARFHYKTAIKNGMNVLIADRDKEVILTRGF